MQTVKKLNTPDGQRRYRYAGRLALKICPDLLKYLAKDVTTLIVTGTNGKTTSSRMLEQCLVNNGCSYIANKSGANLLSGITAEFAANASLTGKMSCDYALIEADEAAFKMVGFIQIPSMCSSQMYSEISLTATAR